MKKHDYFDIWLHEDNELAEIYGFKVTARNVLHAWPLSVVERVDFENGVSLIYKAYYNLPTETDFYRNVSSKYIPKVFYNYSEGEERHWFLFEYVIGQHPVDLNIEEITSLAYKARTIIDDLGQVKTYMHDCSESGYENFAETTLHLLNKLKVLDTRRMREALYHPEVLSTVNTPAKLLHGDFKCNNVIVRPDGELVIIDWHKVMLGPGNIDIYSLLANQGIDPVPIAGIGPEILRMVLEIRWIADCLDYWMVGAKLEGWMANIEENLYHVVANDGYVSREVYRFG